MLMVLTHNIMILWRVEVFYRAVLTRFPPHLTLPPFKMAQPDRKPTRDLVAAFGSNYTAGLLGDVE
jgi:hypothetical protein